MIPNRKKSAPQAEVRDYVPPGSPLYTDALKSYDGPNEFDHGMVDHAVKHVGDKNHTNGPENFWSLTKQARSDTHVSVEPFPLLRYLDEQARRFANSEKTHGDWPDLAVGGTFGKRLTYEHLTVKTLEVQG